MFKYRLQNDRFWDLKLKGIWRRFGTSTYLDIWTFEQIDELRQSPIRYVIGAILKVFGLSYYIDLFKCSNVQISPSKFPIWNKFGDDLEGPFVILCRNCFSSKSFQTTFFSEYMDILAKVWLKIWHDLHFASNSLTNIQGNMTSTDGLLGSVI